jgi:hypothetical protein
MLEENLGADPTPVDFFNKKETSLLVTFVEIDGFVTRHFC